MKKGTNLRHVLVAAFTLGLYVCAANLAYAPPINLITNGDFQSENTAFGSDFTFGGDGNGNVSGVGIGFTEKTYEILDNPSDPFGGAASCSPLCGGHAAATPYFDHTFGDARGRMMAVNASSVATDRVWFQDVSLVAGASYDFSFYISSWIPVNPANLNVSIELGGQTLGAFAAPAAGGVWQQVGVSFTAANILPVPQTLTIRDLTAVANGDDFAIDDLVLVPVSEPTTDTDGDGVPDDQDNCPDDANTDQADLDEDGVGDVCDDDADGDGELPPLDCNDLDPGIFTTAIEICTDGIDNDCDLLVDAADDGGDCDGDMVPNGLDNCPDDANPGQADLDNDGAGDVCDPDDDNDGYEDDMDNCPVVANDQADLDLDGVGDACDADADGDSVDDVGDLCLSTAPSDTDAGVPSKRLGKNRWADIDGDGLFDTSGKNPTGRYYTIDDTAGCNCAQIIEACGYGQGHTKHGCSNSVMDSWTGSFDREGELPYQCNI